jgi:hypothetical protein
MNRIQYKEARALGDWAIQPSQPPLRILKLRYTRVSVLPEVEEFLPFSRVNLTRRQSGSAVFSSIGKLGPGKSIKFKRNILFFWEH